jgi:hypothetical protein
MGLVYLAEFKAVSLTLSRSKLESLSPGLKPAFLLTLNVRDESRTYLRSNSKDQQSKQQKTGEATAKTNARAEANSTAM